MDGKLHSMGRWEPDSQGRMQQAALALFAERGYSGTTAAEIADRAGVTERTFFRHFSDKREVLFAGQDEMLDLLTGEVAAVYEAAEGKEGNDSTEAVSAVEAISTGFEAVCGVIGGRPEASVRRARIVAAHNELQERELKKLASWSDALARVLRDNGLDGHNARLLAEVSVAVFRVAYGRWLDELDERAERDLSATFHETFAELGGLFGHAEPKSRVIFPAQPEAGSRRNDW